MDVDQITPWTIEQLFEVLLKFVGVVALLAASVVAGARWLGSRIIEQRFAKDIEHFKAEVHAKVSIELERARSELREREAAESIRRDAYRDLLGDIYVMYLARANLRRLYEAYLRGDRRYQVPEPDVEANRALMRKVGWTMAFLPDRGMDVLERMGADLEDLADRVAVAGAAAIAGTAGAAENNAVAAMRDLTAENEQILKRAYDELIEITREKLLGHQGRA